MKNYFPSQSLSVTYVTVCQGLAWITQHDSNLFGPGSTATRSNYLAWEPHIWYEVTHTIASYHKN